MVADLLSPNRYHWYIAKVNIYNLNVTEVRHPTLKKIFLGIFDFTVWILIPIQSIHFLFRDMNLVEFIFLFAEIKFSVKTYLSDLIKGLFQATILVRFLNDSN